MHINGQLDDLQYFRVFFPRRILSSAYSLHYYLHSVVAMIAFWRILSWEDFVPGGFCPLPMQLIGQLDYLWHFRVFFPKEDFVPEEDFVLSIHSLLLLTFSCCNDCISEDFVLGGILSQGRFCPLPMHSFIVQQLYFGGF